MVWSEIDPRFGSNQWFEAKPPPDFGQTNGLKRNRPPISVKPMVWSETGPRFGSNQWFEAKPTPDLGQTNGLKPDRPLI